MKPTLLVADDDVELCADFRRFLGARGYEVETAADGLDCLAKLRQTRPALLVLDLELLWGGGDGVLAWLREEHFLAGLPVILTATTGCISRAAETLRPPVVKFLPKPFTLSALLETVRAAIAGTTRGEPLYRNHAAVC